MGSSLAELFYWFIPRAIWPGKPITFSFSFAQLFQSYVGWGGEAYASTTLFGELSGISILNPYEKAPTNGSGLQKHSVSPL